MKFLSILKGAAGDFELNRTVGAFGATAYIIGANAFVAWDMSRGHGFDLTAYCLSFPTGLGVAVGCIAGAVGWKDMAVAKAKVTSDTGAIPTAPPDGPKVPVQPQGD